MRQSNILNSTAGLRSKPCAAQIKEAASIVYRISDNLEALNSAAERIAGGANSLMRWRRAACCVREILRQVDLLLREVDVIGYTVDAFSPNVVHKVVQQDDALK